MLCGSTSDSVSSNGSIRKLLIYYLITYHRSVERPRRQRLVCKSLTCTPSVQKYWCLLSLGTRRKETIMSFGMIVCCLRRPLSVGCRIQVPKLKQTWEAYMQREYLDLVTHVGKSISILFQNTDAIS